MVPLILYAFPIFSFVFHVGGGGRGLEASLCYMGPCLRKENPKPTKRMKKKKKKEKEKPQKNKTKQNKQQNTDPRGRNPDKRNPNCEVVTDRH